VSHHHHQTKVNRTKLTRLTA
ncbi:Transposase, partial [Caenorhabditis elegans]